ncbi:Os06g0217132 [Oryza sativa Japonica Group]|nr:Os06g0217132 [Oryza sativa Japonica Group]
MTGPTTLVAPLPPTSPPSVQPLAQPTHYNFLNSKLSVLMLSPLLLGATVGSHHIWQQVIALDHGHQRRGVPQQLLHHLYHPARGVGRRACHHRVGVAV